MHEDGTIGPFDVFFLLFDRTFHAKIGHFAFQDKFDQDKGQKSAISGRRPRSPLDLLLFLRYLCAI